VSIADWLFVTFYRVWAVPSTGFSLALLSCVLAGVLFHSLACWLACNHVRL
jgi:hypothetical protein